MKITYQYFLEECGRFHKAMGDRSIMLNEQRREAAKNALCYLYLKMECSNDELEKAASTFEGMMLEYVRRCDYLCGSVV